MSLSIVTDRAADADIDEQFVYLAEIDFELGLRFLTAVQQTVKRLAEMPGIGRPRYYESAELAGMRVWSVDGFPNTWSSIFRLTLTCALSAFCTEHETLITFLLPSDKSAFSAAVTRN